MSPLTLDAKTARASQATSPYPAGGDTDISGYSGSRTRFRVITRRPLPPPYRLRRAAPRNPLKRALALAGIPALVLVTYVALWTGAMHGGYYEQRISDQIKTFQIENDALQASLRRLQSPRRILDLATKLGMKPAEDVEFVRLPGPQRVVRATAAALPSTLPTVAPAPAVRPSSPQRQR